MQKSDVKGQATEILFKMSQKPWNGFLHTIKGFCDSGKIDHNQIRKAVIAGFKSGDKKAVLLGSLLLQLDSHEIHELLKEKPVFN